MSALWDTQFIGLGIGPAENNGQEAQMTYSTIYWATDGMVAADGLQSQAVCDETWNAARRMARVAGKSVIVEDRGTRECYRITPGGHKWRAPKWWVPEWGQD